MKYEERIRLNKKSLEAFGVKSRWYALWTKGKVVNNKRVWLTLEDVEDIMDKVIQQKEEMRERLRTKNQHGENKAERTNRKDDIPKTTNPPKGDKVRQGKTKAGSTSEQRGNTDSSGANFRSRKV